MAPGLVQGILDLSGEDLFRAVVLGVVQGATEYLPVSSSGHLVLVPLWLGFQKGSFAFDVLVQLGTLLAVLIYFFRDLVDVTRHVVRGLIERKPFGTPEARFGWFVVVATIPAGVIGILLKDVFEEAFSSPRAAMGFLLLTAALLFAAEMFGKRARSDKVMTMPDAVVIGFAQALALFPGVSRSGSTISAAMLMGLDRESAARFSFVMSIPVMLGAGLLTIKDLVERPGALDAEGPIIAVGFVVSTVTGLAAIKWFLGYVKSRSLMWFAAYCAVVGVVGLLTT